MDLKTDLREYGGAEAKKAGLSFTAFIEKLLAKHRAYSRRRENG